MKLTGITIDGYRNLPPTHLAAVSPEINVIYGEKGAGKTRIADFVRNVLFGTAVGVNNQEPIRGSLDFSHSLGQYRLSRDPATGGRLNFSSTSHPHDPAVTLGSIAGALSPEIYDNVFYCSFDRRNRSLASNSLASFLHQRMNVPIGISGLGETLGIQNHHQREQLQQELDRNRQRQSTLESNRRQHLIEIETAKTSVVSRVAQLEQQIRELTVRISELQPTDPTAELQSINAKIQQLQLIIDTAVPTYVEKPTVSNPVELLTAIYRQLDDIDAQLQRWRSVQNDVQQQRIRLKDEMLLWNEMTLESEVHPYHNARQILINLEQRIDQAQSQTVQWLDSHGPIDSNQAAGFVNDVCQGMRGDLYQLCNELASQYKHIRHRAAAMELKQLRRCYEEMDESIAQLKKRREAVILELRRFDPSGADEVVRANEKFCHCATHEGYLKARQRFVGPVESAIVKTEVIAPDVSIQRSEIAALEARKNDLSHRAADAAAELNRLRAQETSLRSELQTIQGSVNTSEIEAKIWQIDNELKTVTTTIQNLQQQIDRLPAVQPVAPDAILTTAAGYLNALTQGDFTHVWLDAGSAATAGPDSASQLSPGVVGLQLRDRHQKVLNISAVSPTVRSLVELSLILATKQQLAVAGIAAPIILDELFSSFDSGRIDVTLNMLKQFASQGHQVILLTQHRFLSDRIPDAKVFDLEAAGITSAGLNSSVQTVETPTPPQYPRPYQAETILPIPTTISTVSAVLPPVDGYRETVQYQTPPQPSQVTSVSADKIGDRLQFAVSYDDDSHLAKIPGFDSIQLRLFLDAGVQTVSDLLGVDTQQLPHEWIDAGLTSAELENLQSKIWLLTCVPALRPSDADVLVACGMTEPEQLETSDVQILFERIDRYINAHRSDREFHAGNRISRARVNDWHRGLAKTRHRWQGGRSSRYRRRRTISIHQPYDGYDRDDNYARENRQRGRATRNYDRNQYDREPRSDRESQRSRDRLNASEHHDDRDRHQRVERSSRNQRPPVEARPPRMQGPSESVRRAIPAMAPESRNREIKPAATRSSPQNVKSKNKFYLDLDDHIEAAPSIGPKTAERFEKIDVHTISEFLKQTAESMAEKLNYKRISEDVVRTWQHQARLVCRIPNLRGHDAQLLVGCDIIEPEVIAEMQPQALFDIIGPYSDTKEGLKIIRSGKKPDLAEITDWIAWAQQTRSLHAA